MMSAISRLPEPTTRLLGSPLVITTPVALVKELLDNAIDAKATIVEVIISPNTIDKIEVRDNGTGIHPNDYDSLGRSGHTSKLRTFEELRTHGSKTLGFRGVALAAANTVAKVTVITRTEQDPVGATLHLVGEGGGVAQQQKASVPVGTTVRVTELFGRLPVREQVAVKESTKTLDKILQLLKTYAMARPTIRLIFKVLQTPKKNWSYSPKRSASIKEAVLQIAGNEVAAHCVEKVRQVDGPDVVTSSGRHITSDPDSYTLEAYIIDPEADACRFPKQHYFSVDGRPVSAKRGTMKKILDTYVTRLNCSSSERTKDYFIRLNIVCPRGSYDPNVEPSKDEVLFSDEQSLIQEFDGLCEEVYKSTQVSLSKFPLNANPGLEMQQRDGLPSRTAHSPDPNVETLSLSQGALRNTLHEIAGDGSNLDSAHGLDEETHPAHMVQDRRYLPQKRTQREAVLTTAFNPINKQPTSPCHDGASPEPTIHSSTPTIASPQCEVDISTHSSEYTGENQRSKRVRPSRMNLRSVDGSSDVEPESMQGLNPWIIATMNVPVRAQINDTVDSTNPTTSSNDAFGPRLTPEPPILQHPRGPPGDLDVPHDLLLQRTRRTLHDNDVIPGGPYRSPMSSPIGLASQERVDKGPAPHNMSLRRRPHQLPWTPPYSVQKSSGQREQHHESGPGETADSLKQTRISLNRKRLIPGNQSIQQGVQHHNLPFRPPTRQYDNPNIDNEAFFSPAKQQLSQKRSQQQRSHNQRDPSNMQSDPTSPTMDKEPAKTTLPTGDPRAYLLRRQKSFSACKGTGTMPKLRRVKSSLMPLENTPEDDQTQQLALVLHCGIPQLLSVAKYVEIYDKYMTEGELGGGIDMNLDEGQRIEERLKAILAGQAGDNGVEDNDVEMNLGSLLKGKGIAVST